MTKYLIPILTLLLFLYGLLIFFSSMSVLSIGIFTPLLTLSTFIGFVVLLTNRNTGSLMMVFVSICWLLRYFEHASFLILYDILNIGRWILVVIPILLSILILIFSYKSYQSNKGKAFTFRTPILVITTIALIGLCSFARKPHTKEFNCWYYFDNEKKNYRITFATTPKHIWETTTDSEELKELVLVYGIRDKYREGIYCPETKVRIITNFKKIVSVKIIGFRNSTTNYRAILDKPVKIDISKINGNIDILQELDFTLGD